MELLDSKINDLKFEIQEEARLGTKFKVVGVGGGGSNAVARIMGEGVQGVDFYVLNTDLQALNASPVPNKVALGAKITDGLGAGSDADVGRQAALEETERIVEILEGADMVFVTAGLGGGTGTGAAPVVAALAKELNALTVAVVTMPFSFEGPKRTEQAARGLADLAATVDTVIPIYNDRLLSLAPKGTSFQEAVRMADAVVCQAVQGVSDIINKPGLINRDFSDIKATMFGMGFAMIGSAVAEGENAAVEAAREAITYPLMDSGGIAGAQRILVNITGSKDLGLHEVNEACSLIREATGVADAQISFGLVVDESLASTAKITIIATGFPGEATHQAEHRPPEREAEEVLLPQPVAEEEVIVDDAPPYEEYAESENGSLGFDDASDSEDLDTPAYLRQGKLLH